MRPYAALSSDTGDLLRSLEAARLAGEDDLQLRLAEARQSGDALLMEAALTGEAPEPELGGAEPLFAGVSGSTPIRWMAWRSWAPVRRWPWTRRA